MYWVGGQDLKSPLSYKFNNASNWMEQVTSGNRTFFKQAESAPGAGDDVWIGSGLGPTANAPLIYGGYSGGAGVGTWSGASGSQASGGTFNSSLNSVNIGFHLGSFASSSAKYPFPYVGGGFTGQVLYYLQTSLTADIYGASGGTGFGSVDSLSLSQAGDINSPNGGVRLKVQNNLTVSSPRGENGQWGDAVRLSMVKSFTKIGGTAASNQMGIVNTKVYAQNFPGKGTVTLAGGAFSNIEWNKIPTNENALYLTRGLVVGSAKINASNWWGDSSCLAGTIKVVSNQVTPTVAPYMGWYGGVSTPSANSLLSIGLTGILTGEAANDSSIMIDPPFFIPNGSTAQGWFLFSGFAKQITIRGYNDGATGDWYNVGAGSRGRGAGRWNLAFATDIPVTINKLNTDNTTVVAWDRGNYYNINIGTLAMGNKSVLDFNYAPNYDRWNIGSITGSIGGSGPSGSYGASGGVAVGGILFNDETSYVIMSPGVQVYKTNTELSGRLSIVNDGSTNKEMIGILDTGLVDGARYVEPPSLQSVDSLKNDVFDAGDYNPGFGQ
jgi:hypothetical protein